MFAKKSLILPAVAAALAVYSSNQTGRSSVNEQEKGVQPPTKRSAFNAAAESVISSGSNANTNAQAFIKHEAAKGRFKEADLHDFFDNAVYKGNIISIIYRPSTPRPWYEFRTGNSGESKFNGDRQFYAANCNIIGGVSRKYGAPPELIVAIIGIETNYGKNTGNSRMVDMLNTLAFDYSRRAEFSQDESSEPLLMAREEKTDILSFKGGYAGAMGTPQFMPSSSRRWAVDYDGDGYRDIWNNTDDVAASVADYMKAHGWQTGGRMIVSVAPDPTPQIQAITDGQTALTRAVADLRELGVVPMEGVADSEKAVLCCLEISPGIHEYYLGLNNLYAIWKYNHSRMRVTAARDIANVVGPTGLQNSKYRLKPPVRVVSA